MMLCYEDWKEVGNDAKFAQSCLCDAGLLVIMSVVSLEQGDMGYPLDVDIIGVDYDITPEEDEN